MLVSFALFTMFECQYGNHVNRLVSCESTVCFSLFTMSEVWRRCIIASEVRGYGASWGVACGRCGAQLTCKKVKGVCLR